MNKKYLDKRARLADRMRHNRKEAHDIETVLNYIDTLEYRVRSLEDSIDIIQQAHAEELISLKKRLRQ